MEVIGDDCDRVGEEDGVIHSWWWQGFDHGVRLDGDSDNGDSSEGDGVSLGYGDGDRAEIVMV